MYLAPGTRFDGSNLAALMAAKQPAVQLSAVVDSFVRTSWSSGGGWTGAYVALEFDADFIPEDSFSVLLYRQFPGWVGNLDNDGSRRNYTFLGRPWYENQKNQVWCTDTPGFTNGHGYDCAGYRSQGWCCGSGAATRHPRGRESARAWLRPLRSPLHP